ncbi:hypothetical protein [Azospirillum sp.]|uniref:hypothetical protein n=1 Tax=Azospirillum sp. TaxID=34012 RepID=UPI003D7199D3
MDATAVIAAGTQLVQATSSFIAAAAGKVDTLDPRTAFFVGIATWFLVEQAVRRFAGALRTAILVTALVGTGYAAVTMINATPLAP